MFFESCTLRRFIFWRNRFETSFVKLLLSIFARFSLSIASFLGLPRALLEAEGLPSTGELLSILSSGTVKKTLDAAKKGTRNFKQINRTLGFCFRAAEFVPHFGSCNFGVTSGSGSGPRGSTNQKPEDGS